LVFFLNQIFSFKIFKNQQSSLNEIEMHYQVPWQCAEKFKSSEDSNQTRDFFQLVIVVYHEKRNFETLLQRDIVFQFFLFANFNVKMFNFIYLQKIKAANIWVVHLKDQKLNTKIIYNFLKCCNSKIVNINVR
jgi:hypothetical protein